MRLLQNRHGRSLAWPAANTSSAPFSPAPPFSPPSGPSQRLFQGQPAKSKFLAATALATRLHSLCLAGILGMFQWAGAATTINPGSTFTIDNSNVTVAGTTTTWNDTGTLTIFNGGTLQTSPTQNQTIANNDAIVFTGTGGTITLIFNGNDADHMLNGWSITSTATGPQTLDLYTGYLGNGDRGSVTFNKGIPNASGGSATSLNVTFRTQTGQPNWVNLPEVNTFTGPIALVAGSGPATGYLTIGGKLTRHNGNATGSGSLNSGNYPGAIALGASTIFNYASSANQTLAGPISGAGALQVTGSGALTLGGSNTYAGSTTVNSGGSLILGATGGLEFFITDAATNNKVTGSGSATLNGLFTIDTAAVTVTSGSWTLVNTTSKSFGASFGLVDFTGPVGNIYTKSAAGRTWTFNKSSGVLALSSSAIITSFGIPGSAGVINQTSKTIALTVPFGTSLAALAPTFTLTSGSCNPTSGTAPSPTFAAANPGHYIVTDGGVVNDYAVTVSVTPASSAKDILSCDFGTLGPATISGTNILLTVPPGQSLNLAPTFTISPFATLSPASGSPQGFSSAVTYTVTAQDGTTKAYSVAVQSYDAWAYSGSIFILTTPDGANIPAGPAETNFPLLVRLNSNNFNFSQAQPNGGDLRFTTASGANLAYQIEQWDPANSVAAIWVRIPSITGNARQEIKMYWGKSGVTGQSSGASVFNAANGYTSVIHLNETLLDEAGSTTPGNSGTTVVTGLIGKSRRLAAGQGIACGTNITAFPTSGSHSSQAWIKADAANSTVLGWGIEQGQGKVVMQLANPPRMNMDCYFGGGNVTGGSTLGLGQWIHVVHTYQSNAARIYVNGVLDGSTGGGAMNIPNPARMYIGGWYNNYNFAGDIDEVRVSNVVRSANWVKMEYENQKPLQTMVGSLVQPGSTFSATPSSVSMPEATSTDFTGQAGGAQKVYWIRKQNGVDTVLAVDQFTLGVAAGRVTGNQSFVIQFKAIYPTEVRTVDIPVTVTEAISDPQFTLSGPSTWDGRQTIAVTPVISNLSTLQAQGAANFSYKWTVDGVAVAKQITPGTLTLTRAQGDGPMTVTLVMENGGSLVTATKTIAVQQPASDPWVQRTPDVNEKPVNNQFFARDPGNGNGTIHYRGTQSGTPDTVFIKLYTTHTGSDVLYATHRQALAGGAYSFAAPVAAGKATYKVVYGTTTGGIDTPLGAAVTNLICGDAYIIEGQSNALATDNSEPNSTVTDPWIRSYGKTIGWGSAVSKGGELQLGLWGMILAKRLSTDHNMPICIINGAVGGTRIDQHRPNPAGHSQAGSLYAIYADLYNRVVGAKLTHGIRAVLWHQGEQDQGSGGPDGDYDYKFYQQYFVDISASWKQDFPNILNYYVFQIWPNACGDTSRNDQLREVQRTLSRLYSNMRVMGTLGIVPGSSCHYELAGYQAFSDLIAPLVKQDVYGHVPPWPITAPNLKKAYFTNSARTQISLEFSQDMAWTNNSNGLFYLDGAAAGVTSGTVTGKIVRLQLAAASSAAQITYLKGSAWNGVHSNLLLAADRFDGFTATEGIAALTFADVPIAPPAPTVLIATPGSGQIALSWTGSPLATGYNVKRSLTTGGPYAIIGTAGTAAYTDATVVGGTPCYYVVSATRSGAESLDSNEAGATPSSTYAAWAAAPAQGLTPGLNDAPTDDPDFDRFPNLLEFALGGAPTVSSQSIQPVLTRDGGGWVFEYDRSDASKLATTQVVEYGSALAGWTPVPIPPAGGGIVTITPGSPSDRVKVAIPTPGPRMFVRLKVTE